jgi:hypothetical protein
VGHDDAAVGDVERELYVLLDEQDAGAGVGGVGAHDREHALDDHRRKAEAELVDEEQSWSARERAREGEHLLLAAGEQPGAAVTQFAQRREVAVGVVGVQALAAMSEAKVLADGYRLKPYDVVLVRTDVSRPYDEPGYELRHPGLRRDATAWLVAQGVRLIGIDAWGIDRAFDVMSADARAGDDAQLWESHKFGADEEYCQIEKLCNLDALPTPHGFQVLALPIHLERASGAWARVVALI